MHEFDEGIKGLSPFIRTLDCPVLISNIRIANIPELARLSNLKTSVVVDVAGTDVGIIGYLTPKTKIKSGASEIDFIDEVEAIQREVNRLKSIGINIIIALGSSGYIRDQKIAQEVQGLSLVVGGHSHTFLWRGAEPDIEKPEGPYPTYVIQSKSGKQIPVVQAYAYTKYLGKIHMVFDSNGNIISSGGAPILLDKQIPNNPYIMTIMNHYHLDSANASGDVTGSTAVILDHTSCIKNECNLGNLITDSIVFHYAYNYKEEYWTDASIAIMTSGSIKASIGKSSDHMPLLVTKAHLLKVIPFANIVVAVELNAGVLIKMLEHSVASYEMANHNHSEFLHYSGLSVVYDIKKPAGSRVVEVYARCRSCIVPTPHKISDNEVFKVLMTDFLYNGGYGYTMFKGLPMKKLFYSERLCIETYFLKRSPIRPEIEGRIKLN